MFWSTVTNPQSSTQDRGLHRAWWLLAFEQIHNQSLVSHPASGTAPASSGSHCRMSPSIGPSLRKATSQDQDLLCCMTFLECLCYRPQLGRCCGSLHVPPSSGSCPLWFVEAGRMSSGFGEGSSCLHTVPPQLKLLLKDLWSAGFLRSQMCHCSASSCSSK